MVAYQTFALGWPSARAPISTVSAMASISDPKSPKKSLAGRTSLITVVAIAGVAFAGTAAIAANIGILNAADDGEIGTLSAADDLLPPASVPNEQIIEVVIDEPTTTPPMTTVPEPEPNEHSQDFAIDVAGTVALAKTENGLHIDDVVVSDGWTWTSSQQNPTMLTVTFTNGGRTFVFTASLSMDGSIIADVTEPIVVMGDAPAAAASSGPAAAPSNEPATNDSDSHFEDDHDDHDDHDEYEDDEGHEEDERDEPEEEEEHEGADDDD
jgi:hypothetical protein